MASQTNIKLVHDLSEEMNDAKWFLDERLKAFKALDHLQAPEIERLDYTAWNLFERADVKSKQKNVLFDPRQLTEVQNDNFYQSSTGALHAIDQTNKGMIVADFRTLFNKEHTLFKERYKNTEFLNLKDRFNAFNLAFLTSGLFIYIPKDMNVKEPLKITFLDDVQTGESRNHQVFIYAEANSAIEIIENYSSIGEKEYPSKLNVHVHLQAQAGANVKYTAINELVEETQAFFRRTAQTERDALVDISLGIMNNGNAIEDVQVDLLGDGSSADIKSVAISHSSQVQCINAKVINHGSHTIGNIYQHGVVLEQATLTFNGIGDVLKNAKHSDAQQESRILMLSDEARADTNPLLLIDEYELTAGHAASISRIDEDQLYYLMSRGLGQKQAEKLVIRGFLGSVLSAISIKEVREKFIETIERKLSAL